MSAERETWTDDGERFAVIDYNHLGIASVTREAMHALLERAGFVQAQPPTMPLPSGGRERLREVHDRLVAEESS